MILLVITWPDVALYLGLAMIGSGSITGALLVFKPRNDPEAIAAIKVLKEELQAFSARIDRDINEQQKELLTIQTPVATNTAMIEATNKRIDIIDQYTRDSFRELKETLSKINLQLEKQANQQQEIIKYFTTMQKDD